MTASSRYAMVMFPDILTLLQTFFRWTFLDQEGLFSYATEKIPPVQQLSTNNRETNINTHSACVLMSGGIIGLCTVFIGCPNTGSTSSYDYQCYIAFKGLVSTFVFSCTLIQNFADKSEIQSKNQV